MLEQHDGLGIGYLAGADHFERRCKGKFDDFNLLAFIDEPAAVLPDRPSS